MFSRITTGLIAVLAVAALSSVATASLYHLQPTQADLNDLDHAKYYTWGINKPWPADSQVVAATLTISQIRNWDNDPNILYIHLLDSGNMGVTVSSDHQGGGDAFAGKGVLLTKLKNLTTTPHSITYILTQNQIDSLNSYSADGRFALGFDPDCHYYNCGVALDVQTELETPEPATMALLAAGGLVTLARRRRVA